MATANRAIKAKPEALPEYLDEDLRNARVIRRTADGKAEVQNNSMVHLAPSDELSLDALPEGEVSVPLAFWQEHKSALIARDAPVAVQLSGQESEATLAEDLQHIDVIVFTFVNYVDGRSYSKANGLRTRLGFRGELRAVGDVHFDQLGFLARVGVDAFEIPDDEDHEYALRAFTEFSEVYQPAADGQPLIFSRRRVLH